MSCVALRALLAGLMTSALIGGNVPANAIPSPPYPINLVPGGQAEQAYMIKAVGSQLVNRERVANPGGYWVYALPVIPGKRCYLQLSCDTSGNQILPVVKALGLKNKPLHVDTAITGASETSVWKAPAAWKLGTPLLVTVSSQAGTSAVVNANYSVEGSSGRLSAVFRTFLTGKSADAITILNPPSMPITVTAGTALPDASTEPESDAVLLSSSTLSSVDAWMGRGYAVWSNFAPPPSQAGYVDTDASGKPLQSAGAQVTVPVTEELKAEVSALQSQLAVSGTGVVLPGLSMPVAGGYSVPFQQAWNEMYGSPWQAPASSPTAGYQAGHLMSRLLTQRLSSLQAASVSAAPGVSRIVSLLDPVSALNDGLVAPAWHIGILPTTNQILFQLDPSLWQAEVPMQGALRQAPFSQLVLSYAAAAASVHDLPVRCLFQLPALDTVSGQQFWQAAVTAAITAAGVDGYFITPPSANDSPAQKVEAGVLQYALQQLTPRSVAQRLRAAQVAVAVSDSLQWHNPMGISAARAALFGETLPLMVNGYPLRVISLERTVDPATLASLKTLVVSYDNQVPIGAATNTALATWVNQGGSLVLLGGGVTPTTTGWWTSSSCKTGLQDLWERLAVRFSQDPHPSTPPSNVAVLGSKVAATSYTDLIQRDILVGLGNAPSDGSLAVRIAVNGAYPSAQVTIKRFTLLVDGKVVAAYLAGSSLDSRFLVLDSGSSVSPLGRTIAGGQSFTYRFDNLPAGRVISCQISETGPVAVTYGEPPANTLQYLVPVGTAMGLAKDFPLLQVKGVYGTVQFPGAAGSNIIPLYTAPNGAPVIWAAHAGRGMVFQCGIPPEAFSGGDRSGTFLRALVALALQDAGGYYREQGALVTTRGQLIAVHTYQKSVTLDGRTADLFSPDLQISNDRTIAPHTTGLFWQMPASHALPTLQLADGRIVAKLQTASITGFVIKGPLAAPGMVLLQSGGRDISGLRAIDYYGRPIPVQATNQGNSVLLQFPLNPDGVAVRVAWKKS